MNTEKNVGLACFIGAIIGTILSLQFSPKFWWLGIVTGGLAGYLSYEFMKVVQAVRFTFSIIQNEYSDNFRHVREVARVIAVTTRRFLYYSGLVSMVVLIGLTWELVLFVAVPSFWLREKVVEMYSITILISLILGICVLLAYGMIRDVRKSSFYLDVDYKTFTKCLLRANPLSCLFYLIFGIYLLLRNIPAICRFLVKFGKNVFLWIHSEIRILCAVYSMTGALAGYMFKNALLGGVVGLVLGVMTYRLISIRLLKSVPIK